MLMDCWTLFVDKLREVVSVVFFCFVFFFLKVLKPKSAYIVE